MEGEFVHQVRLDLVRSMLLLGLLPGRYELDLVAIRRKFEDSIGQLMIRPLVIRGIDGVEYLCDSRFMGFSKKEVVKILDWDEFSGLMTVTDGRVTVCIDARKPGRVYDCRKFVNKPESAIDRFTRLILCDPVPERFCRLAHDCDLLEDIDDLPDEKCPLTESFEHRVVLLLAGLISENELCLKCRDVVKSSKRFSKMDGNLIKDVLVGSQTQRDALRGDLLQKYHFLTIAEFLAQSTAYTRIGELFSNSRQREFLELPGESEVREKYQLSPQNNDHTWGTAVEAEYQLNHDFRLRYVGFICREFCGWIVSDTLLRRVVFLEKN